MFLELVDGLHEATTRVEHRVAVPTLELHELAIGLVPIFAMPTALSYLDGDVEFDDVLSALNPPPQ